MHESLDILQPKGSEMMEHSISYKQGFIPYGLAALLIGLVGGFSTVLGPAFVQDIGIAYTNTTWTALAQAMSTAACAPILGKVGDMIGVEYHRWDICHCARVLGKKLHLPIYQFLKEPLIRRFGQEWYDELCLVAEEWKKQVKA